jgi:serine/threonine protein kinase
VAIKVLKKLDAASILELQKECQAMSAINDPNVVQFYGGSTIFFLLSFLVCLEPSVCLVIEYCELGNLCDFLQKPEIFTEENKNVKKEIPFDWQLGLRIAIGIAKGLLC